MIDPYFMAQLLKYGMERGKREGEIDSDALLEDAEVCFLAVCGDCSSWLMRLQRLVRELQKVRAAEQ